MAYEVNGAVQAHVEQQYLNSPVSRCFGTVCSISAL